MEHSTLIYRIRHLLTNQTLEWESADEELSYTELGRQQSKQEKAYLKTSSCQTSMQTCASHASVSASRRVLAQAAKSLITSLASYHPRQQLLLLHLDNTHARFVPTSSSPTADMTNFWDLPKKIRERIYRLLLVFDEPVCNEMHQDLSAEPDGTHLNRLGRSYKHVPLLLRSDKKIEKEAAVIYYSENHFDVNVASSFVSNTLPRHYRFVRKLTCTWSPYYPADDFKTLARLTSLQELNLRVDEEAMLDRVLKTPDWLRFDKRLGYSEQLQLQLLRHPGMRAFSELSGIPLIRLLKNNDVEDAGGPLPGGFLETVMVPQIMRTKSSACQKSKHGFRFLDLPAELRNRVYHYLLRFEGTLNPSKRTPTSSVAADMYRKSTADTPEMSKKGKQKPTSKDESNASALSLLAVNCQIHDQALGIFYNLNDFIFYWPTQLQGFLSALGPKRRRLLRSITLWHRNHREGGTDTIDFPLEMLRSLDGLRELTLILPYGVVSDAYNITRPRITNPGLIPGVRTLSSMRGLLSVRIRDMALEKNRENTRKRYDTATDELEYRAKLEKGEKALAHLNKALLLAQSGKVMNMEELLKDNDWQNNSRFPKLAAC